MKINTYMNASLQCRVVPQNISKMWEDFAVFNKTI